MTSPSSPTPAAPFRLRTFGPPALLGAENDTFLGKHGSHRRRLALLAVLAAAGARGRSRDQLLLLFWPEVSQARARHSLDQLLYALRGSIGESVFDGTNPLRLNPAVVASDVGTFKDALERGDLEAAVDAHRGPFLDGFYLSDAPEFEQWVESERSRLAAGYAEALEKLAISAAASEDHATAVRRWRTLAELDPVSNRYAAGLVGALMNAGDHAAALQHAKRYEAFVAQELGLRSGAGASLVDEVRARTRVPVTAAPVSASASASAHSGTSGAPRRVEDAVASRAPVPPSPSAPGFTQPTMGTAWKRQRWLAFGALAVMLLVAAVLWQRPAAANRAAAAPGEASIAVLPFTNLSTDPRDAVLVDGLREELITTLSKIPNLRVVGGISANAFRNDDLDVRTIADSLNVSNVLETSGQMSGSRLRLHVRLVSAADAATRWSEKYDREVSDVFAVQSDIAAAVARELELRLTEGALGRVARGSTSSIPAYEAYLRGNDQALMRSDSGARRGLEYFRQAIALDTLYAAAYAGLARMYLRNSIGTQESTRGRLAALALAEAAARRAIVLDDSLAAGHSALALVGRGNYDIAGAEAGLKRAVALDPGNSLNHEWLVQLYIFAERPAEALVEAQRALAIDPLSPTASAEMAHALQANNRCDEAVPHLARLQALRPPLPRATIIGTQCLAREKRWAEAVAALQRSGTATHPIMQSLLGYFLARAGRRDEARAILDSLLARSRRVEGGAFEVATVYAGLGEANEAMTWMEKSIDDRSMPINFWYPHMVMNDLPRGPRLNRLRQRLGLQKR